MKVVQRIVAVLFVAIAAFLVYAVIAAFTSTAGARIGVCIGYIAGAIVLTAAAVWLWRPRSTAVGHSHAHSATV